MDELNQGALRLRSTSPRRLVVFAAGILIAALSAPSCGAGGGAGEYGNGGGYGGDTGTPTGTTTWSATTTTSSTTPPPPPEKEVESSFGAPVATGKYVWIANPASGRVAYIDATNLEIKLVDAGHGPTHVAAVPHPTEDVAIVLNVLSSDATILRASPFGLTAATVPVPAAGNAWAVSPDGRWAIAWSDARRVESPDPVDGYQDISVIDMTKGAEVAIDLTVGYRPVAVAFSKDGNRAFAVTQDGVTVVALNGGSPKVVKNIALGDTPSEPATTRDVSITPDGAYALVRREGKTVIDVFSLSDGTRTAVTLPAPATDLDLSADGATAIAVVRETSEVVLLPIPGIVADPASAVLVHVDASIGSTSLPAASPTAFFYTNATPSTLLAVMDSAATTPSARTVLMRAPILAVFPTPDASHAVVLHNELDDAGSHFPAAVSLAPIALDLPPKIVGLEAPTISIAVAPTGDHALIATGDDTRKIFQLVIASMPSLKVKKLPLASLPIAAGIVPSANRGYVAQKHPDGRITFVDLATSEARTITGFELATQVVDGAP